MTGGTTNHYTTADMPHITLKLLLGPGSRAGGHLWKRGRLGPGQEGAWVPGPASSAGVASRPCTAAQPLGEALQRAQHGKGAASGAGCDAWCCIPRAGQRQASGAARRHTSMRDAHSISARPLALDESGSLHDSGQPSIPACQRASLPASQPTYLASGCRGLAKPDLAQHNMTWLACLA